MASRKYPGSTPWLLFFLLLSAGLAWVDSAAADAAGRADNLYTKGSKAYEAGGYVQAAKYFLQAADLDSKAGLPRRLDLAYDYKSLGLCYEALTQTQAALDAYVQSQDIFRELGEVQEAAQVLNLIGLQWFQQGQYPTAAEYFREYLKAARKVEAADEVVQALNNLGTLFLNRRDYMTAARYFLESIAI
ncbi:MAG TPA: tetratricopeptide repeat protein [Spirochaetales bacterium]|nr:tetratricopeptide repeat protein [Spirochaetales bacterium]